MRKPDIRIEDEDASVMMSFRNGDEEAFGRLLAKYEGPLINFIYRFVLDRHEAEDIAQEVFLRVYRSAPRYEPTAKFSTWLFRIAANACLDHNKKKRRDKVAGARPLSELTDEEGGPVSLPDLAEKTPEEKAEQKHVEERVRSCLGSLPENQRLALVLKVYEGRSYQEIAEILDCSVPAVESLLFRARQTLKGKLCDIE